jgi:hypothetical protein
LLLDIGWIFDSKVLNSFKGKSVVQSSRAARLTRIIRVMRVMRITRIVKLYKQARLAEEKRLKRKEIKDKWAEKSDERARPFDN